MTLKAWINLIKPYSLRQLLCIFPALYYTFLSYFFDWLNDIFFRWYYRAWYKKNFWLGKMENKL